MAFFRRSKSPFQHEIDRFYAPEPAPEQPPWMILAEAKSSAARKSEAPAMIEEQSADKPVAQINQPENQPAPLPNKRGWLGRRKPERPAQPLGKPIEKPSAVAKREKAKEPSLPGSNKPEWRHPEKALPAQASRKPEGLRPQPQRTEPPRLGLKGAKASPASPAVQAPRKPEAPRPQPQKTQSGWFGRRKLRGSSQAAKEGTRSSDLTIAALGIALGLTCALFPWYIFFNQEKFGVRAMKFEGGGAPVTGPLAVGPQPQRVGAPMSVADVPLMQLDLLATGTLPDKKGEQDGTSAPGLDKQPFPGEVPQFKLVHVANGRAMIEDDAGLWIVQAGSTLPDSSQVESIEKRDGKWVLVTSADRVVELTP